jgi:hypothetical protein
MRWKTSYGNCSGKSHMASCSVQTCFFMCPKQNAFHSCSFHCNATSQRLHKQFLDLIYIQKNYLRALKLLQQTNEWLSVAPDQPSIEVTLDRSISPYSRDGTSSCLSLILLHTISCFSFNICLNSILEAKYTSPSVVSGL